MTTKHSIRISQSTMINHHNQHHQHQPHITKIFRKSIFTAILLEKQFL